MKKAGFYCATLIIVLAVFFIAFEIIAPKFIHAPHLVYRFWGNRPVTFYPGIPQRAVTNNYDIYFKANSRGYKDVEHEIVKGKEKLRVLLLGDSYVEAVGVRPQKHMARVIELLAENDGNGVEVISMGMSGFGQAHQLAMYERIGKYYNPDIVITFFVLNDFWNNSYDQNTVLQKPLYNFADGHAKLAMQTNEEPESFKTIILRRFINRFETYFIFRYAYSLFYQRYVVGEEEKRVAEVAGSGIDSGDVDLGPNNQSKASRVLFDNLVNKMAQDIVERDGKAMVNVYVTSQIKNDPSKIFGNTYAFVKDTFGKAGVETINFDSLFRKMNRQTGYTPSWKTDAHWNEYGHKWVGEELYRYLKENYIKSSSLKTID